MRAATPRGLLSTLVVLVPLAAPTAYGQLPFEGALALRPAVPVRAEVTEGATRLRIGRGRASIEATVPGEATDVRTRVVDLSPRRRAGVVEVVTDQAHWAGVVALAGRRPSLVWSGRLDWRGDPGERRRDVLLVEDRTGDGAPDLIVATEDESRRICGQGATLLAPRALDPRTGELRTVTLRRLPEAEDVVVTARREARPPPRLRGLSAAAASSRAGREDPDLPVELIDEDPGTAWAEGRPGPGRWEFVTLRWQAPYPLRAIALTLPNPPLSAPRRLWLVHQRGRLEVSIPEPAPGPWWIELPDAVETACLSIVLDEAADDAHHVGLAELAGYTDLDLGAGLDGLLDRLAHEADAGASARLLARLGAPAVEAVDARWPRMTSPERRVALRVFAAHADTPLGRRGLLRAAQDEAAEVRQAALDAALDAGSAALLVALLERTGSPGDRAALALARRHPAEAAGPLLDALARDGGWDRPTLRRALRTAFQRGADRSALEAWLPRAPASARAAVALALARGGEATRPLAAAAFEAALDAEGPEEEDADEEDAAFARRWRLVQAAARLGPSDAVDRWLTAQTEAPQWMLRAEALEALAARRSGALRAKARAALTDEYPRVRMAAVTALQGIGLRGREVEAVARRARRDPWPMVRAAGVRALGPVERARPVVLAALEDPSPKVRAAAVRALVEVGDGTEGPAVLARLEDEREWPEVLVEAIRYARARCRRDASPALETLVRRALRPQPWTPDIEVAAQAAQALATIDADAEVLRAASAPGAPAPLRNAIERAPAASSCASTP